MPDDIDDVTGLITEQIERRFDMSLPQLRRAVAAAPDANREATEIVRWHGLLTEAQNALGRAEDHLVAVLKTQPGELDHSAMEVAHQVNAAVSVRDGRAMAVKHLLNPQAPGKRGPGVWRGAAPAARRGPVVPTTAPVLTGAQGIPVNGATR